MCGTHYWWKRKVCFGDWVDGSAGLSAGIVRVEEQEAVMMVMITKQRALDDSKIRN